MNTMSGLLAVMDDSRINYGLIVILSDFAVFVVCLKCVS